jgi:hypothetical protein
MRVLRELIIFASLSGLMACSSVRQEAKFSDRPDKLQFSEESARSKQKSCKHCDRQIIGKYIVFENNDYHNPCYFKVAPQCGICRSPLLGSVFVLGKSFAYHPHCFKRSQRCNACSLPAEGERGGALALADGRRHCRTCVSTAISDIQSARAAMSTAILDIHRELGIDLRAAAVELKLTDRYSLARLAGLEKPLVKGFTEARRKDIRVGATVHHGSWSFTIWVLRSLPQEAMIGVLAHELFHVWQVSSCHDQSPALREGSANYVQWRVLKRRSQYLWADLIEHDKDPIYGGGFRRFKRWRGQSSWSETLSILSKIRDFPSGK